MLLVEDGVPVPERALARSTLVYPFSRMRVGQSFVVECPEGEREVIRRRVRNAVHQQRGRGKLPDGFEVAMDWSEDKLRVWRIA